MTKKLSIIASGLLLSSTMAFAADSIDGAFKDGKVSGSVGGYYAATNNSGATADSAYASAGVSLTYETASYNGFSAKATLTAASEFYEKEDGDASDIAQSAILSEAAITYTNEGYSITAGRQAVDLEWMGDYHEAVVFATTLIPNTTLVLGYTDKKADDAGFDAITSEFYSINGSNGAYVADAKFTGIDSVELNPYFYSAPDLADWYGLKATYTSDMFGLLGHYAASSEDIAADNGSMLALEASTSIEGLSLALGYIKTDKDGGIGSMAAVGDNYEPMDDGSAIYAADAKMIYGTVGYSVAGFDLGAAYSQTKIASDKDKELNLMVDYGFTDALSGSLLYVDINSDTGATSDQSYVNASLTYSF